MMWRMTTVDLDGPNAPDSFGVGRMHFNSYASKGETKNVGEAVLELQDSLPPGRYCTVAVSSEDGHIFGTWVYTIEVPTKPTVRRGV